MTRDSWMIPEQELLEQSTGYVDDHGMRGYFTYEIANSLVATGNWTFAQVTPFGYVVERRKAVPK